MELRLEASPDELQIFLAETRELLQGLDERLVRLEQDGAHPELLQEVFRAAHTIKGSAATLGHERMAYLTHAMETLLDRLRSGLLDVETGLVDLLLAALDGLKILTTEVEQGRRTDLSVETLARALESWQPEADSCPAAPSRRAIRPTSLAPPDGATHHILLGFQPGPWAVARAMQAYLALGEMADILVSNPSLAAIERQEVHERLEAWIRIERTESEIHDVLASITDVSVLNFQDVDGVARAIAEARGDAMEEAGPARARASTTVRVDVERLDKLLTLVGELLIHRTRLAELVPALCQQIGDPELIDALHATTRHLGRVTDELQAEVMKSRMLPIQTVFSGFPRVVRDLASRQGKRVDLRIEGQETELDRSVLEAIRSPLVHLLRNAVDHGVEPPGEREMAGKPPVATVRLAAERVGSSICIVVEDDGRGIDAERVRARAVEQRLLSPDAATDLSSLDVIDVILAPGFTTAAEVSDISGRGVGLDIVRTNVERLGGSVELRTTPGRGSRFVLRLPAMTS